MDANDRPTNGPFTRLLLGDCLERLAEIEDGSVDLVLCDLPYGATQNVWDSVIPLDKLWAHYRRVCRGAVVLNAMQPFASTLVASNPAWFRYSWTWVKSHASNPMNAKRRPMQRHEEILVFAEKGLPPYFPQMQPCEPFRSRTGPKVEGSRGRISENYGTRSIQEFETRRERYPTTDLRFGSGARRNSVHPTQKPVELMAYLIRTYTKPGAVVLDNAMGSGSTGLAAVQTGRSFIGIEQDPDFFNIASGRIEAPNNAGRPLAETSRRA